MRIRCPNCSANLSFKAREQKVYCEYCNSSFEIEDLEFNENEMTKEYTKHTCDSCGAELISTEKFGVIRCTYCGGKKFVKGIANKEYILEGIIPFKLDKEQFAENCIDILEDLLKIKLTKEKFCEKADIKGIYVPFSFKEQFFENQNDREINRFIEKLLPYDFKKIKKMNPLYLDDFLAEGVKQKFEQDIFKKSKPYFYWVPIWTAEIEYDGNMALIVMNGETWETAGQIKSDREKNFPNNNFYNLKYANIYKETEKRIIVEERTEVEMPEIKLEGKQAANSIFILLAFFIISMIFQVVSNIEVFEKKFEFIIDDIFIMLLISIIIASIPCLIYGKIMDVKKKREEGKKREEMNKKKDIPTTIKYTTVELNKKEIEFRLDSLQNPTKRKYIIK